MCAMVKLITSAVAPVVPHLVQYKKNHKSVKKQDRDFRRNEELNWDSVNDGEELFLEYTCILDM